MYLEMCFQPMLIFLALLLSAVVGSLDAMAEKSEWNINVDDIVRNHNQVDHASQKSFANPTLAFVTPWNSDGYDWAKLYGRKFSHISPVWFQLMVSEEQCSVHGAHDIDQEWVADVRRSNPEVLIVPRVLIEYTEPSQSAPLFVHSEQLQDKCFKELVNFVQRNRFDGVVFEYYLQTLVALQLKERPKMDILQMVINLGELLRMNSLQLLLVLPPCAADVEAKALFTSADLHWIENAVDYVIVMTYDYPPHGELARGRPPPLSPVPWLQRCMDNLKSEGTDIKLMMGLNFYGYLYDIATHHVDTMVGSTYLQKLVKPGGAVLKWDEHVSEHYTLLGNGQQLTNYPTTATIQARCRLADQLGVGLAIWDLGQGLAQFLNYL